MGTGIASQYIHPETTICKNCFHKDVCGNRDYLSENICYDFTYIDKHRNRWQKNMAAVIDDAENAQLLLPPEEALAGVIKEMYKLKWVFKRGGLYMAKSVGNPPPRSKENSKILAEINKRTNDCRKKAQDRHKRPKPSCKRCGEEYVFGNNFVLNIEDGEFWCPDCIREYAKDLGIVGGI